MEDRSSVPQEEIAGPQQTALRLMSPEEREAWFFDNIRQLRTTGMLIIKVDRHLAASGYDDTIDDMIQRFDAYVTGSNRSEQKGAMG